jgi:hypothetical protein
MSEPAENKPSVESTDLPGDRVARRVRAVEDVLRTTIRDLFLAAGPGVEPPPGPLDFHLRLQVDPSDGWRLTFSPDLPGQLEAQLREAGALRDVFRPGRVHCFRCGGNACVHAAPPSPLDVFRGFDGQGRPEWGAWHQVLIDAGDARVEQLFAHPPRLVASMISGRALKEKQSAVFGKSNLGYSVLGQVCAGYFDRGGGEERRLALTLQVVETRGRDGVPGIRLNPVGYGLEGHGLAAWLTSDRGLPVLRAVQIAERECASIERLAIEARAVRNHARWNQVLGRVPGVLRRLVEALERGGRQEVRRTRHVEERRRDQRPVHKAVEDALRADPAQCYLDEKAKTFMVIGARGRVHAFSAAGRHVTSFAVKPSAVALRLRTGRWQPADAGAWGECLQQIRAGAVRDGHEEKGTA